MQHLDTLILSALRGPEPPQTVPDLAALCDAGLAYTYSRITELIKSGELSNSECPWRKNKNSKAKPATAPGPLSDLESSLERIISENSRDRVSALRELRELRTMGGAMSNPPSPKDHKSTLEALARMLKSAGRPIAQEAFDLAFTETSPTPDLAPTTPSGDSLD